MNKLFIKISILVFLTLGLFVFTPKTVQAGTNDSCKLCNTDEVEVHNGNATSCIPTSVPSNQRIANAAPGYCPNIAGKTFVRYEVTTRIGIPTGANCLYTNSNGTPHTIQYTPARDASDDEWKCNDPKLGTKQCMDPGYVSCDCYRAGETRLSDKKMCDPKGSGNFIDANTDTGNCNNGNPDDDPPGTCPADEPGGNGGDGSVNDEEKPIQVDELTDAEIQAACKIACDGITADCPCFSCIKTPGNVWTELGCIKGTAYGATLSVMRIAIGVITGIVLLRFIQAGILYGSGDPEKLKEASSIAISAAAALIFLGLCIVLINFAGIKVLGFGKEIKLVTG